MAQDQLYDGERSLWSSAKTNLLLTLYLERVDKFRDPKIKKKNIWSEIKAEMLNEGYSDMTEDALDRKMRNLKATYRNIKDNNNKTGRGRLNWQFYAVMEEIFKDDRTMNPGFSLASSSFMEFDIVEEHLEEDSQNDISMAATSQLPSISLSPIETPSQTNDNASKSALYRQRQEMLEMEKERVASLKHLEGAINKSLELQETRNRLLEKIYEKM